MKRSGRPLPPLPPLISGVRPLSGDQRAWRSCVSRCKLKEQRADRTSQDDDEEEDDDRRQTCYRRVYRIDERRYSEDHRRVRDEYRGRVKRERRRREGRAGARERVEREKEEGKRTIVRRPEWGIDACYYRRYFHRNKNSRVVAAAEKERGPRGRKDGMRTRGEEG